MSHVRCYTGDGVVLFKQALRTFSYVRQLAYNPLLLHMWANNMLQTQCSILGHSYHLAEAFVRHRLSLTRGAVVLSMNRHSLNIRYREICDAL